ncbi:MAG: carbohydrate ABC transporter permease [Clostridiales bacterium]|jgi:putative aldouronate transport system permease protein|nr:carbohydrate ABC transporter permease [Clostridiales bacterium]
MSEELSSFEKLQELEQQGGKLPGFGSSKPGRVHAIKQTRGETVFDVVNAALLTILCLVMIYPFWYVLVLSFNTGSDASSGPLWLWPRVFTIDNYKYVFAYKALQTAYKTTLARVFTGPVLTVGVNICAGFALSKRWLPARRQITFFLILPMFFGGSIISTYVVYTKLGLLNNFLVYILPGCFQFFNMVIMRTFIEGIPIDIEESAMLDGAGYARVFLQFILPLSRPIIACFAFFSVCNHWLDLQTNLIYVTNRNLQTLQYLLYQVINSAEAAYFTEANSPDAVARSIEAMSNNTVPTPEVIKMTVMVVVTFPILLVYPFFQKSFIKGMLVGAVKA